MNFNLYSVLNAFVKLYRRRLGHEGWQIFFAYVKLRLKLTWKPACSGRVTFYGYDIEFVDPRALLYLVEEIFVHGIYEFESASGSPLIIDCGSNIGLSLLFFKRRYPRARIIAFEADPETFAVLSRNVIRNGLAGVVLHNLALADKESEMVFHRDRIGSLSASVFEGRSEKTHLTKVKTTPLSAFIHEPVDFLKMDIEGAELMCIPELANAGKLEKIRKIALECHHNVKGATGLLTTVFPFLEKFRFSFQLDSRVAGSRWDSLSQDVMVYAHAIPERS